MIQTFEEFLSASQANIPVFGFILNIILSALLAISLSWIYARYANSLSNRKQFGKNFLLITMTTMLIISVVKSSLALSLGLVGALSIVRFRTAIKEPEELAYLFLSIAIGLGLGADQTAITIIAFIMISIIIIITKKVSKRFDDSSDDLAYGLIWRLTRAVDTRIEPFAIGLSRFDSDDISPLLQIVKEEGIPLI